MSQDPPRTILAGVIEPIAWMYWAVVTILAKLEHPRSSGGECEDIRIFENSADETVGAVRLDSSITAGECASSCSESGHAQEGSVNQMLQSSLAEDVVAG